MKLHIFNPEHDIALARNDKYFTAPRAGRRLREDCGFLPALCADEGDFVLVGDVAKARQLLADAISTISSISSQPLATFSDNVNFVTLHDLHKLPNDIQVEPWGWDSALLFQLTRNGLESLSLPDSDQLSTIRALSNRRFSSSLLRELMDDRNLISAVGPMVGQSWYATTVDKVRDLLSRLHSIVVKEPWSSSGRGVRYITDSIDTTTENWIRNTIAKQGGIMVEPRYKNIADLGMEFYSDGHHVVYRGLSFFSTCGGFYEGNIIASEEDKAKLISPLLPKKKLLILSHTLEKKLSSELAGKYTGPLGVDMLITDNHAVHPMVEINLRRTMGHVAIDMYKLMKSDAAMDFVFTNGVYHFNVNPVATLL